MLSAQRMWMFCEEIYILCCNFEFPHSVLTDVFGGITTVCTKEHPTSQIHCIGPQMIPQLQMTPQMTPKSDCKWSLTGNDLNKWYRKKIRNGVDSMKSPRIYEKKTKYSSRKTTIKTGKHTVPNDKIDTARYNFWASKKKKEWVVYNTYTAWSLIVFSCTLWKCARF